MSGRGSGVVRPPPSTLIESLHAESSAATANVAAAATERRKETWRNMERRAFGVVLRYERIARLAGETSFRPKWGQSRISAMKFDSDPIGKNEINDGVVAGTHGTARVRSVRVDPIRLRY